MSKNESHNWIQRAIHRPGILKQKAKAAGVSLDKFLKMKGHDQVTQKQVNLALTLRKHAEQRKLYGILIYAGRRVNSDRFRVKNKDFRRLVGYCCMCGRRLRGRAAIPKPDPFAYDVHDDDTPVVQCESCCQERADEI